MDRAFLHHQDAAVALDDLRLDLADFPVIQDFDRDLAIEKMEQAVAVTTAPPSIRISSANLASESLIGRDNHRAKSLLQTAVQLLPTVSPRTLTSGDQQYNIAQFAGITSRAASLSLECGEDAFKALQL